jgi:hypothetical protein
VATPGRTRRPAAKPASKPAGKPRPKPASRQAAEPRRPASRTRQRPRSRAAIAWIVIGGVLLAGVVFINLAVLRLNLQLDNATQERSNLRAANAALQSQLSSALASPRIQALAHTQDGLIQADPSTIGYINLARP